MTDCCLPSIFNLWSATRARARSRALSISTIASQELKYSPTSTAPETPEPPSAKMEIHTDDIEFVFDENVEKLKSGGYNFKNGFLLWYNNIPHYYVNTTYVLNENTIYIQYKLHGNVEKKYGYFEEHTYEFIECVME